jgi:hypothetical protein
MAASVEHAKVEERHREKAQSVMIFLQGESLAQWEDWGLEDDDLAQWRKILAQALADAEAKGNERAWAAADAAIRAMQPGPAREETYFERHSANSKMILDCTRALHDARPR